MLDHIGFSVHPSKFASITAYYSAALAPLGISKQTELPGVVVGFGPDKQNVGFWIAAKEDANESGSGVHIAFSATDHGTVDRWHAEAVKAGGTCNGRPGFRSYHEHYYAAFVIDPVGNNIEVVDHMPH